MKLKARIVERRREKARERRERDREEREAQKQDAQERIKDIARQAGPLSFPYSS